MTTIAERELRRGDVLLVTAHPRDRLAELIVALDGAPDDFSHGAIALGDGRVLSARPAFDGLWWPIDLGGLHVDELTHYWDRGQRVHRLTVPPCERARAAALLDAYTPCRGSFSVPKIVTVAAVLHALSPSNDIGPDARARVVRRGLDAARAWERDGDFYCAEFVATLYDWRFTLADLVPPRWGREVVVPALARLSVDVVGRILLLDETEERQQTISAFLDEVRRSDPGFLGPGPFATVEEVLDRWAAWLGAVTAPDGPLGPVRDGMPHPATPLPAGLVTPRMLRARHLGPGDPPLVRDPRADSA